MTPESCNLSIFWASLHWARSRGNTESAATGWRIDRIHFHSNEYNWKGNALHRESRQFVGNAYRNFSVHTATNLQSSVTVKNAITLLLKEMISMRFDQNLPQGENWPTEDGIRQNTVYVVSSWFIVMKCYSYSKIVLQLIVAQPGEYPVNWFIWSGTH
jgi:hypothetical protein